MKKGDVKKKRGFTIIEVSLVLAIAGLIFLMVFVALPSLQRQQRDTRRREDVLTLLGEIKKYQTNNRGMLPSGVGTVYNGQTEKTGWQEFYNEYLGANFIDPSGYEYALQVISCSSDGKNIRSGECDNAVLLSLPNSSFPYMANLDGRAGMVVVKQAMCDGSVAVGTSNPRNVAVLYKMEGAGVYCANT